MGRDLVYRHTYRPPGWGEHWHQRAVPRALAGGGAEALNVHLWGDSNGVGDDASSVFGQPSAAANSTAQKDAWRRYGYAGVLEHGLQERFGNAGEGFQPVGLAVTTGTWFPRTGPGMSEMRATAAASLTWKVRGTTVHIYWRVGGLPAGTNQFRYQVDGGSFTTVTQTGATDPGRTAVTGLSDGEHTVRVEWVAGTAAVNGVRGLRDARGARVDRFALHGQTASFFSTGPRSSRRMTVATTAGSPTITAGTGGYFTQADVGARILGSTVGTFGAFIGTVTNATTATLADGNGAAVNAAQTNATGTVTIDALNAGTQAVAGIVDTPTLIMGNAFAPGVGTADLVVLALGANDSAQGHAISQETYQDGLSRIIRAYHGDPAVTSTPDYVVVIAHIGTWLDLEEQYARIAGWGREVAAGVGAAVVDCWAAGRRTHQYPEDQRYWSGPASDNAIHLSQRGHGWVGNALLALTA